MVFEFTNFEIRSLEWVSKLLVPGARAAGIKTDGAFLPRILLSCFILVSVVGDSALAGLQTSVRRGAGPVYSAPLLQVLPR